MLEQELISIGLNEKEARIYLSSLELGQSTVQNIAIKSAINRATTYFIIDSLMQRGLMSSFHKGKKQYFIASDPDNLIEILEKEKENIENKKENLKKLLPQLQSLNNKQQNRPIVKYYEGKDGITAMVDEFLKTEKVSVNMAYSVNAVNNLFSEKERLRWRKNRIERDIDTKVLYTYKEGELPEIAKSNRIKIPFEKFPVTCDIAIYDNKIRLASLGKRLSGIIIEDEEIARSLKAIFDLAWEGAKQYKK
jgi:sugar-specific transcriptional regulator TrmB